MPAQTLEPGQEIGPDPQSDRTFEKAEPFDAPALSKHKARRMGWRWAFQSGRVDADPMAKLQPADDWGVNAEHLSIVLYSRLLRVVAGAKHTSKTHVPAAKKSCFI